MKTPTKLTAKQQFWFDHLQRAKATETSLATYAKQENLNLKALYNYQTILRKKGVIESEPKFTRLIPSQIKPSTPTTSAFVRVNLLNGISVDIPVSESGLEPLLQKVSRV